MYRHHEESLQIMKDYFRKQEGVIALVFGGSVAKGNERIDSDLDGMVIVSEENYAYRLAEGKTAETIHGLCTYEGGYFDVKYMTKSFLMDAADKGSEPTRNSFVKSRVLFSDDPEIPDIVARIPVFQKQEKEAKCLSFYADYAYNHGYFLRACKAEGYARVHAINEILYSLYRITLQEHEILFPCNRRLEDTVAGINSDTARLVELGKKLAVSLSDEDEQAFSDYFFSITTYEKPTDFRKIASAYTQDFEQWWRIRRPNVNEW